MRRPLIILLLLAIVGAIGWWLLKWNGDATAKADPWTVLPVNAAVVVEVPSPVRTWDHFTSTSQWWTAWDSTPGCAAVNAVFMKLRDQAEVDARLEQALENSTLLIAFTQAGEDVPVLLVWPQMTDGKILERMGSALHADLGPTSEFVRTGRTTFRPDPAFPELYLATSGGLLLLSDHSGTLDDALNGTNATAGLSRDSTFLRARRSLGAGSDAHVLLHTGRAQRMLTTWLMPDALSNVEGMEGWVALDVRARPEAVLCSGLWFPTSPMTTLHVLRSQDASRLAIARVLPESVRTLRQVFISDAKAYCSELRGQAFDPTLFDAYGAWCYGATGTAIAGLAADSTLHRWAVIQAEDPDRARRSLDARCTNGPDTLSYRGVRITRTADTSALAAVWGSDLDELERPWYCVFNDKVVFADEVSAMRECIDAWTDGSSLSQEAKAGSFFQRYASDAGLTWWWDVPKAAHALRMQCKERGADLLDQHQAALEQMGAAMLQVTPDEGGTYQISACFSGNGRRQPSQGNTGLWSASVGAPIIRGPYLLTDHLSRTLQVLVQDAKNRISLISCTGKVIWQRELDGPIMGEVHQVDRYRNGKLQMLFNTEGKIHLIDRNGTDVEHFPIALTEKASAPLNVFDYDGKKEYRILLPTVEAHLLNFGLDGKAVQGWVPPTTPATCSVPVQHLRLSNKDYLILVDHNGGVSVLDRKGAQRYTSALRMTSAKTIAGIKPAMDIGDVALLWTDEAGNQLMGLLSGHVDTLARAADPGLPADAADALMITDADHDGQWEVVRAHNGEMIPMEGVLAYPPSFEVAEGQRGTAVRDINLDGGLESVNAHSDGRLVVGSVTP